MQDIITQMDVLGLGFLVGALLFLAGLVFVLVDNCSFELFEQPRTASDGTVSPTSPVRPAAGTEDPDGPVQGGPSRPPRARRAA